MYGNSVDLFYLKSKLVFWWRYGYAQLFSNCICSHCRNNCLRDNRRKNKILNIPYLFFDDDFYLPNFWALGLARRRLVNLGFIDFAGSTVVHSVGGWAALVAALW
jgi:hypothetical protein